MISGGGLASMEAANKGAFSASRPGRGAEHPAAARTAAQPYQDISQTFRHFFCPQIHVFVRFASTNNGDARRFRYADELLEALTLIQTGKARQDSADSRLLLILGRHDRLVQGNHGW